MNGTRGAHKRPEKNKAWKILIGIGLTAIIVISVCVGLFYFGPTARNKQDTSPDQPGEMEATKQPTGVTEQQVEDLLVETPFCTLHYPGKWSNSIKTEYEDLGYGYIVRFYGASGSVEAELFSVMFGYSSENAEYVGTFTRNGISTDVNLETAALVEGSWAAQDVDQIRAMQAAADYVVEKMKDDPFFNTENGEGTEVEIPSTIDIIVDTPYCVLQFPAQWKDALNWEILDNDDRYDVVFSGTVDGKVYQLFTFSFGESTDSGFQVGVVWHEGEMVEVYLTVYDAPSEENWTDTQRNLFAELQEQAYYVLENLSGNPNYMSEID